MSAGTKQNRIPQNGFAIREIREREGLTVSELARAIAISDAHLRNIELENRPAKAEHLARISKQLRCRLAAIVRRDLALDEVDAA